MALSLHDLDEKTRAFMKTEIERDQETGTLYLASRLSMEGQQKWPDLLKEATLGHDDNWLANQIRMLGLLNATETRRTPSGGTTQARVPVNAPEVLAEGEFNRFYLRGLCLRAMDEGISHLIVYRAKAVSSPRPESERMIGQQVGPDVVLNDLRTNPGVDTALKLPNGPNSGLSLCLP